MIMKRILRTDCIRQPRGRFSFIPHRFLLDGFLKALSRDELLLYFFLVLTADKNGVSYYGQASYAPIFRWRKISIKRLVMD